MTKNTNASSTNTDFTELIDQVAKQHRAVTLHATNGAPDVVLISKTELDTAQAIINASIGRPVPFLMA